jgi:hypothetical protein
MDIALILETNYAGSEWTLDGEEYSGLVWLSDSTKPTKAALEKQWADVQYQVAVKQVQEERRQAYTLESDPLAFKYQETELSEDKAVWLAKKAEIQARYPDPEVPAK